MEVVRKNENSINFKLVENSPDYYNEIGIKELESINSELTFQLEN